MSRAITFGEALGVLTAQEIGPIEHVDAVKIGTGGAEANVAIGLSRLGVSVVWCGVVGDDPVGRRVVRELRAEGVEVQSRIDGSRPSGLILKERTASGRTDVTYYRRDSAGSTLMESDIDAAALSSADLLHVSGITPALSTSALAATRDAIARAKSMRAIVSFDVNHRSRLWDRGVALPIYRELAGRADIVFAGLDEARIVLDDDSLSVEEALVGLRGLGPSEAIIKMGSDGAIADVAGAVFRQDAFRLNVMDTVGAGDAFVSGYLAERLRSPGQPDLAMRLGSLAGAAVCRSLGDWESGLRLKEIKAFSDADPVRR